MTRRRPARSAARSRSPAPDAQALRQDRLVTDEGRAVLDVVSEYARSWLVLQRYDEERLELPETSSEAGRPLTVEQARRAVAALKRSLLERRIATDLFGNEREHGFEALLGSLEQTFGGRPLYGSVEEKAAHLLYFVIKDHPFSDGNKRIGSFLFVLYLRLNGRLEDGAGKPKVSDVALVTLALLVAASDPRQKELLIRLILNLLTEPQPAV
jgi:prophage maintenance system killer protein